MASDYSEISFSNDDVNRVAENKSLSDLPLGMYAYACPPSYKIAKLGGLQSMDVLSAFITDCNGYNEIFIVLQSHIVFLRDKDPRGLFANILDKVTMSCNSDYV